MRVKYLAQEHNVVPRPGLEPGPPNPESSALTIRPLRLPHNGTITDGNEGLVLTYTEPGYKVKRWIVFFYKTCITKH